MDPDPHQNVMDPEHWALQCTAFILTICTAAGGGADKCTASVGKYPRYPSVQYICVGGRPTDCTATGLIL